MKYIIWCAVVLAVTCAAVLADSYITEPSTCKRLHKWDGEYLMKPNTSERLYKWDGTYIMEPSTSKRLYKWDGEYLMTPNTGKRLVKTEGRISVAVLIALATGLL